MDVRESIEKGKGCRRAVVDVSVNRPGVRRKEKREKGGVERGSPFDIDALKCRPQ